MKEYASRYAAVEGCHWWFGGRAAIITASLGRFVAPGSSLLDVGCGTGGLTAELSRTYDTRGVDQEPAAVELARRRGVRATVIGPGEPLSGTHQAVCAFDVLEHMADDVAFVGELRRASVPGGVVAVTVPAYARLWGPMDTLAGHVRRYRLRQLESVMARAGLSRLHATYFNTLLFPAVALLRLAGFPRSGRELDPPPGLLNAPLRRVFAAEAAIAPRVRLPFGASILYVGRSPGAPT